MANDPNEKIHITCAEVYGGTQRVALPIELPGLEGYLYSQPCESANGGDIHYVSICGSGVLSRFCLADVVGHGSDVAVISAETHALLKKSMNWTDNRRVLRQLNKALAAKGIESLTTAGLFTFYPPTSKLSFSYAGHPVGWQFDYRKKSWLPLEIDEQSSKTSVMHDLPLAVDASTTYSRSSIKLRPGDIVILATDGITDVLNHDKQRLGDSGLFDILVSTEQLEPRAIVEHVLDRVLRFSGAEQLTHDDVTMLALRVKPFSKVNIARNVISNRLVQPMTSLFSKSD